MKSWYKTTTGVNVYLLSYKWKNNIEKLLTRFYRLKAKLKFQIICFTLASLQNKLHCRQISEMLPRFLCSSVRV